MVFLDDLATNATERSVHVIIYEGNDDGIVAHLSAEGEHLRSYKSFATCMLT